MSSGSKSQSKTEKTVSTTAADSGAGVQTGDRSMAAGQTSLELKTVLDEAITGRWQTFARHTKKARSNPAEKTIHDLRVATRRMMALLDLVRSIYPGSGAAGVLKQLDKQLQSLSTLRDTQVQILKMEQMAANHQVLLGLIDTLKTGETAQTRLAQKEIDRAELDPMQAYFDQLRTKVGEFLTVPAMQETAPSILWGMLAKIFVKTVILRNEIRNDQDCLAEPDIHRDKIRKIHDLRLHFKRFRYSIEILEPILPRVTGRLLKRMSEYQSKMGTIQDTEMLISLIDSNAKRLRKKNRKRAAPHQDPFAPLQTELKERLRNEVSSFLVSMDDMDEYWEYIKQ